MTLMLCGTIFVSLLITGIDATYEPARIDPVVAWTITVAGTELLLKEAVSQPLAPKPYAIGPRLMGGNDPPPAFVIVAELLDGFAPPSIALNDCVGGLTPIIGPALTLRVTTTNAGEFPATASLIGTEAV